MLKFYQIRITAVLLALATVAAVALAVINFNTENAFQLPQDGVWWVEAHGGLQAERVLPNSPGRRAGIKAGDLLVSANDEPTSRIASLMRQMARTGIYGKATYTIVRTDLQTKTPVQLIMSVILEPADHSMNQVTRFIALVYLLIGLYILFRRWTAPKSTHFYIFCLVSFVLYAFHYTGKLNSFDWVIYWGNLLATALQPALFLHFAMTFPEERSILHRRRWFVGLIYLPGLLFLGLNIAALALWSATEALKHRIDQIGLGYLALYYVIAAIIFFVSYQRTDIPLRRQQLKWLTRGTLLAVVPFTLLYVIPFLSDVPVSDLVTKLAGLSLVFLPLTFSYAIVRYRLMDVDLIFKRGVTYSLATAALVGLYFGLVAVAAEVTRKNLPSAGVWGLLAAIIITAQLFDPIKRAIQERVDRIFDRKRYDYRETLIEFGRGLNTQTDLRTLVDAIVDRLPRTLLVSRTAVFVANDEGTRYTLEDAHGVPEQVLEQAATFDLGFLDFDQPDAGSHIFLDNPQQALHLTESERRTASMLDMNYYLPCRVQDRTIAVIGMGRTVGGDFLSSEDMELLESLASYIGIAIQNARLYSRLERKIAEYERLKEFNENIVESINIGILAVDLEDHIESWNAQMEVMYATPRAEAIGQPLASLLPADFITEFNGVKHDPGVHNLYKFRLATRAGDTRVANIAIAPLVTRDFETVGRIILVDDMTDRIQLEAQLTQAEKLSSIGLLAAGVAHEVNTPLAVISSYAQMLTKHARGDEKIGPLLEKITQQTFRASEIVNGLLNFSRTSAAEFTRVDLNHVIRETLVLLEHQFKTAQVTVDMSLEDHLPAIHGNQGKLQQVFLNLFLNAKDAMNGGGTLCVKTVSNGHVGVIIQDSGSGIAPEHMQKIYDPFFTTKNAPKEGQRRGTGLGLAVTYGIIQEHAGKIHVESRVGQGTCFQLEFPLSKGVAVKNPAKSVEEVAEPTSPRNTIHA
ncbi:MAG: GAF domain-containing sensor histidine kinase [Acidobacteriaceae bacterium]